MSPDRVLDAPSFFIDRLVVGPLDNNVYLVTDREASSTLIVDAADEAQRIIEALGDRRATAIVTTHGHADHHQAAPEVSGTLGIPVLLHPADGAIADLAAEPLESGDLTVGSTTLRVVHTPGHTPGSACLVGDGVALTGDTLFPGGPGATRFTYSDFDQIIESIRTQLFTLPDATVVLPGHGAATTVGRERPQLQDWINRRW